MASWEDDDPVQDEVDLTGDNIEDDLRLSTVLNHTSSSDCF